MPTFANLIKKGLKGNNGLVQAFPPNTGVGWHTLATGTYPGEHGSMNNTYHRIGEGNFNNRTAFATTGVLQADTIQQAAERAGKKVVSVEWVGSRNLVPPLQGPVVDFRSFFSNRGVLLNYDLPGQLGRRKCLRRRLRSGRPRPGGGLVECAGLSFSPAMQERLKVTDTGLPGHRQRRSVLRPVYLRLDQRLGHQLQSRAGGARHRSQERRLRSSRPGGRPVGRCQGGVDGRARRADLLASTSRRLRSRRISRASGSTSPRSRASTPATMRWARLASAAFEETLASAFPTSTAGDFAPLEAGIVDEDTRCRARAVLAAHHFAYLNLYFWDAGCAARPADAWQPDHRRDPAPVYGRWLCQRISITTRTPTTTTSPTTMCPMGG